MKTMSEFKDALDGLYDFAHRNYRDANEWKSVAQLLQKKLDAAPRAAPGVNTVGAIADLQMQLQQMTNAKNCLVQEMAGWEKQAKDRLVRLEELVADKGRLEKECRAMSEARDGAKAALVRELTRNQRLQREIEEIKEQRDNTMAEFVKVVTQRDGLAKALNDPKTETWFPTSNPPHVPGVYEIKMVYPNNVKATVRYSLWDGKTWHETCNSADRAQASTSESMEIYQYGSKAFWRGPRL